MSASEQHAHFLDPPSQHFSSIGERGGLPPPPLYPNRSGEQQHQQHQQQPENRKAPSYSARQLRGSKWKSQSSRAGAGKSSRGKVAGVVEGGASSSSSTTASAKLAAKLSSSKRSRQQHQEQHQQRHQQIRHTHEAAQGQHHDYESDGDGNGDEDEDEDEDGSSSSSSFMGRGLLFSVAACTASAALLLVTAVSSLQPSVEAPASIRQGSSWPPLAASTPSSSQSSSGERVTMSLSEQYKIQAGLGRASSADSAKTQFDARASLAGSQPDSFFSSIPPVAPSSSSLPSSGSPGSLTSPAASSSYPYPDLTSTSALASVGLESGGPPSSRPRPGYSRPPARKRGDAPVPRSRTAAQNPRISNSLSDSSAPVDRPALLDLSKGPGPALGPGPQPTQAGIPENVRKTNSSELPTDPRAPVATSGLQSQQSSLSSASSEVPAATPPCEGGRVPGDLRSRRVIWIHLHKFGGTTICNLARSQGETVTSPNENCNLSPDYCSEKEPARRNGCKTRLNNPSFSFTAVERAVEENDLNCPSALYGIMLRDPISALKGTIAQNMFSKHETASILEAIRTKKRPPMSAVNNHQHGCLPRWDGFHHYDNFIVRSLGGAYDVEPGMVTEEHFENAKVLLNRLDVVLILEELSLHTVQLEAQFGWDLYGQRSVPVSNAHSKRQQFLTTAQEVFLRQVNALDYKLYEFALALARQRSQTAQHLRPHCRRLLSLANATSAFALGAGSGWYDLLQLGDLLDDDDDDDDDDDRVS